MAKANAAVQYEAEATSALNEKKKVVVDKELAKIHAKHGGITAELVLAWPSLREYFEWDDKKAAHRHRLAQAQQLIMTSKYIATIQGEQRKIPVRKIVSIHRGEPLVFREDALSDAGKLEAMVEAQLSRLRSWCDNASDIPPLAKLRKGILKMLEN